MNVLLVVMDSVRARNTSLYGHPHETTPFLERFADRSTVYDHAISPGAWSLPSHASLFTGLHVAEHGVTRADHRLRPGNTVFEWLAEEYGHATAIFSQNTWVTEMDVGLKGAFDLVEGTRNVPFPEALDPSNFVLSEGQGKYLAYLGRCLASDYPARSLANGLVTKLAWDHPRLLPGSLQVTTPGRVYADLFLDWVADRDGPWAACVNLMDGHMPYEPDADHDRWGGDRLRRLQDAMDDQVWEFLGGDRPWWQRRALEGLYDGTIRQMDAAIERVVEGLADAGALDDTLLVVTSDHGEGFGEPSRLKPDLRLSGHGKDVHEALLHVPLVANFPDQTEGTVVRDVATLTRFPEVVKAALAGTAGRDAFVPAGPVVASVQGLDTPSRKLAEEYCGDVAPFEGVARAVYGDRTPDEHGHSVRKFLDWEGHSATVRVWDAGTARLVDDTDGGRVEEAFSSFSDAGVSERGGGVEAADRATRKRLEDLGYL